ncbi:AAEL007935-PH, partial [Aedes aegypti]
MRWFMIVNVYDSIRPVTHLLKWFGLWSNGWRTEAKCQWKAWYTWLYVTLFMVLNVYTAFATIHIQQFNNVHNSLIIGRSVYCFSTTMFATAMYSILCTCYTKKKIETLLKNLHEVDSALFNMKTQLDHQRHHFQLVLGLVGIFTVTIALTVFSYEIYATTVPWFRYTVTSILTFIVTLGYFTINMVVATTITSMLLVRLRALNATFRMYFPTTPSCGGFLSSTSHTETVICNEKEQLAVLKQIKILHDKLNDVVELVNYCFSVQITFCVGLCFVIGVVCSFGLFRAFIYRNELFYMGVLNFVWYMYYLFFVLFFIAVGSKITREGKRIGVLVHKAINCASSSAVINELNIFSQQLLHRSPVITCGLFVYDWTLLYTMIGATATYLIILIQFDVSFPNLVNVNGTQTAASGV